MLKQPLRAAVESHELLQGCARLHASLHALYGRVAEDPPPQQVPGRWYVENLLTIGWHETKGG